MIDAPPKKLSFGTAIGYGIGDLSSSLAVTTNALFLLKFATDHLMLSGSMAGLALMLGKFFDALTDPMMGEISDRTRHRWGSKRPYLLYGALPFGGSFFLLYSLPHVSSPGLQFALFAGCCSLQSLCFTICNIPYTSMTASLTQDAKERTRLTMFRFFFSTLATILVASATLGIAKSLSFAWVGAIYGSLMTLSLLTTFATTTEPSTANLKPPPFSLRRSLSIYTNTWRNRPFRILLGLFVCHTIAFALLGAWIIYYAKHSLLMKNEELVISPMIATTLVMLIPWYFVSKKIGKKQSYLLGSLWSISAMLLLLLPPPQATIQIITFAVLIGIGFASYTLFPYAMIPDVIEYDELEYDERREGIFYGVWVFAEKVGRGCAFLLAGWGLSLIGYTQKNTLPAHFGNSMKWLISTAPILFLIIGILFLWKYPLTETKHQKICEQLKARRQQTNN